MFFERPEAGETAVLVHVDFYDEQAREDPGEFLELVRSAGAEPATLLTASRQRPDSRRLLGQVSWMSCGQCSQLIKRNW